jgi:hypothetical protein
MVFNATFNGDPFLFICTRISSKIHYGFLFSENRTFSFKTAYFGTMALLQDTHQNMPFQCWDIRPHKTNAAVLSISKLIRFKLFWQPVILKGNIFK